MKKLIVCLMLISSAALAEPGAHSPHSATGTGSPGSSCCNAQVQNATDWSGSRDDLSGGGGGYQGSGGDTSGSADPSNGGGVNTGSTGAR